MGAISFSRARMAGRRAYEGGTAIAGTSGTRSSDKLRSRIHCRVAAATITHTAAVDLTDAGNLHSLVEWERSCQDLDGHGERMTNATLEGRPRNIREAAHGESAQALVGLRLSTA